MESTNRDYSKVYSSQKLMIDENLFEYKANKREEAIFLTIKKRMPIEDK